MEKTRAEIVSQKFPSRVGIPAFAIDRGDLFEDHNLAWGHDQMADYVAHHYRQASDEYHADWDFRGNAKLARFGFVLGWLASEADWMAAPR